MDLVSSGIPVSIAIPASPASSAAPAPVPGGNLGSDRGRTPGNSVVPDPHGVGEQRSLLTAVVDTPGYKQNRAFDKRAAGGRIHPREDDHLERSLQVLECGDCHRFPVPRRDGPQPCHDATHDNPLPVERLVLEIA